MDSYWSRIAHEPLTPEQEIAACDAKDHDLLLRSQIRWIYQLSKRVSEQTGFEDMDALMADGMAALWKCLKDFDARKARLTTWCAMPAIWGMIKTTQDFTDKLVKKGGMRVRSYHNTASGSSGSQFHEFLPEDTLRNHSPNQREYTDRDIDDMRESIDILPPEDREFINSYIRNGKWSSSGSVMGACKELGLPIRLGTNKFKAILEILKEDLSAA